MLVCPFSHFREQGKRVVCVLPDVVLLFSGNVLVCTDDLDPKAYFRGGKVSNKKC